MKPIEFKITEEEFAKDIVNLLQDESWEVYHEVQFLGGRVDIVATQGRLVRIVETKMSLTPTLIGQASRYIGFANFIHVVVPKKVNTRHESDSRGKKILEIACKTLGIGVMEVLPMFRTSSKLSLSESITVPAKINRRICTDIFRYLKEEQKGSWGEAGNARHEYYTPWRQTCRDWRQYVDNHPGCTLKEVMTGAKHHYRTDATCKSSMRELLNKGIVKGIELRDGKLYPKEEEKI